MSIIKNTSAKNVELQFEGGGTRTLTPNSKIERKDVSNLLELKDKVKVTENLTEVMNVVDKTDLSEIHIKQGSALNG